MGWGSGIEVARQARATQSAIQHGDYRAAVGYAQKAANAAPQNPDLWFTLAYAARLAGQYSVSVGACRQGLTLRPGSIEGLSGLAQTYARMGKADEAGKILDQVLAANPRSATDLQLAGELLLESNPAQAIEHLARAEAVKPSPRSELLLARAYQRTGKPDQARRMLEQARQSAPSNPEVLRAVAAFYRDSGQYDAAIRILRSMEPKDAMVLSELGYTYQLAGDQKNAAQTYLQAAQRAPAQIEIQLNAAQALVRAGDSDRAAKLLDHAASLSPDHYRLHAIRGELYSQQHRDLDAMREYEAALERLPSSVPEGPLYPISLELDLLQLYRDQGNAAGVNRIATQAHDQIQSIHVPDSSRPEYLRLKAAAEVATGEVKAAEADLKEALQLQPASTPLLLNYANLLWKTGRGEEARRIYLQVLDREPANLAALSSLGFLVREEGDSQLAETYFAKLARLDPNNHVPFLALGDLYSSMRKFDQAQANYEKAFEHSSSHPAIISGAMNAALEARQLPLAKEWLDRSTEVMKSDPAVMREHERYLTMTGNYERSAELGFEVLQHLPNDREAVDYLAYDLLFLGRFDEALAVVERYEGILKDDRDLPLIAGYVHAHDEKYELAIKDFTRALEIDPKMATGYMNRGYVYNDLRMATRAEADFRKALSLSPNYGEAHLGLAYSLLQLRRAAAALKEAQIAGKFLPESESLHLAQAEAYRQRANFMRAEAEYRAALRFNPNEPSTYLALSDVQYRRRQYVESLDTLNRALSISQQPAIYAQMARTYAQLKRDSDALQAVETAERSPRPDYKLLLATADVFRILGKEDTPATGRHETRAVRFCA